MGDSVITYRPGISAGSFVEGKYAVHATPAATNIYCGFVPSRVEIVNATDEDAGAVWTADMADGTAMDEDGTAIASNGITPIAHTNSAGMGFTVGTDSNVLEASKTYTWRAYR